MFVISATLALRLLAYVACAVTRIAGLIPLLHDEEAVAREAEIRVLARRLDGAVREQQVDARDADAEADLLRVRAAEVVLRRRRARQRLGKVSANVVRLDLKPVVLTFATLLPIVSMRV